MIIYLDFDGTVVEHTYPRVGIVNQGVFEVLERLQKAGHTIVLNTYRADLDGKEGTDYALKILNTMASRHNKLTHSNVQPIIEATEKKIHPTPWKSNFVSTSFIFLDDQAFGAPLIKAKMEPGDSLDWSKVTKELEKHNII